MTLIKKLSENRICILMLAFAAMFLVMAARLYSIQIKNGQSYAENAKATVVRTIQTPSIRGNIYDKYGRVLAENKVEYNLMLDLSVKSSGETENILALIEVMERFGIEININDFPIKNYGGTYQFDFTGQSREKQWKTDMGFRGEQMDFTAGKTVEYLSDYFGFDDDLAGDTKIKLMAVMCRIHLQRYRKYQSVTVSENIDRNFISYIEEHSSEFSGIYVGESWYRYYPYGECMANIIGYTGNINEDELEEFESYGYKESDKIGKTGIEKSHELFLRGKEGKKTVEVDAFGARVSEFDSCPAQRGKDIYLSIDAELQKKIYDKLKESLKSALFDNINSGRTTVSDIMASLADNNIFNWNAILEAQNGAQLKFKNILLNEGVSSENTDSCGSIAAEKIKSGAISQRDFVDCLIEQKIITPEKTAIDKYESGAIAASELILNSILNDEIGINRVNMDPSTGSAVVEDVNTGKILAMVSFPSYDNNRLANEFDSDYYNLILSDKTSPLINRPAMERKAPGSVFKMLSAAVGLEEGVITENTIIYDKGIFKDTGKPYAKCLIYSNYGITHGAVDVRKAIEVSCNYYFYDMALRLGNMKNGTEEQSIRTFNKYMEKFGLGDYSGIEIEEYAPQMASVESKTDFVEKYYADSTDNMKKWTDGDSIRNAIGQSNNNYSAVSIAKYISTLANGESRYKSTLIEGIGDNGSFEPYSPVVEEGLGVSENTVKVVHEGMLMVTEGDKGTLRSHFKGFPVRTAAKTGTAEENKKRPSHSWFAGFAPYDNPQIAVVVLIPFGEGKSAPAINTGKEAILEYMGFNYEHKNGGIYENVLAR